MLELFSRVPDLLAIPEGSHLTPIPIDGTVSSLSVILVEEEYYGWIRSGARELGGVPIVGPEHLVPLKARAWLDLRARKEAGERVDARSIRKHKNDVYRLSQVLDPACRVALPPGIATDVQAFLRSMRTESVDLKSLGLASVSKDAVAARIRELYDID